MMQGWISQKQIFRFCHRDRPPLKMTSNELSWITFTDILQTTVWKYDLNLQHFSVFPLTFILSCMETDVIIIYHQIVLVQTYIHKRHNRTRLDYL